MITIQAATYYSVPAQSIIGEHLRLVYLTGEGPRLVGLYLHGDERNFLAELPELGIDTPNGRYHLRGGHRLWVAPEDFPLTYLPDSQPPLVETLPDGVRLTGLPHALAGLSKRIEIHLHPDRPALTLHHWIENNSQIPVNLAPWAITQLPTGGVAVLPQNTSALDAFAKLPNRVLVLWPYMDVRDARLSFHDDFWQVRASGGSQFKIGCLNLSGWTAYLQQDGRVFVKRHVPQSSLPLPDMGANVEVYTDDHMIELETLGPMVTLLPGQSVCHDEGWEIYPGVDAPGLDVRIATALQEK